MDKYNSKKVRQTERQKNKEEVMILKIRTPDGSWAVYDNFEKVRWDHYSHNSAVFTMPCEGQVEDGRSKIEWQYRMWHPEEKRYIITCPDVMYFNFEYWAEYVGNYNKGNRSAHDKYDGEKIGLGWAIARNRDGDEKLFVFDQVAYLCNDQGQTIDKIIGPGY